MWELESIEQDSLHAATAAGAKQSVKLITFYNMPTDGARCAVDGFVRGRHFCLEVKHSLIWQARLHIMQKEGLNGKQMHMDKNNQCFHNLHL